MSIQSEKHVNGLRMLLAACLMLLLKHGHHHDDLPKKRKKKHTRIKILLKGFEPEKRISFSKFYLRAFFGNFPF